MITIFSKIKKVIIDMVELRGFSFPAKITFVCYHYGRFVKGKRLYSDFRQIKLINYLRYLIRVPELNP